MSFQLDLIPYKEIESDTKETGRFYHTPIGSFPSVTTILSASGEKKWLDDWKARVGEDEAKRIVKEATNRGSKFHLLMEKYILNEDIDWKRVDHVTKGHFVQVKNYLNENIECVLASEIPVYSRKLKCAGRVDAVVKIGGEIMVLDFKTSKHAKEEIEDYRMQCSAYIYMMNELYGLKIENYRVLISNLYENFPTVFEGNYKDHIGQFAELRKKWFQLKNT